MAGRLTDVQKQNIIADRVSGMSLRRLADKYDTSVNTIIKTVRSDPELEQKLAIKREQTTKDMFTYMDEQRSSVQALLSAIVEALNDPAKLAKANVRDLATAYGILTDKYTMNRGRNDDDALKKAKEILGGINGVIS